MELSPNRAIPTTNNYSPNTLWKNICNLSRTQTIEQLKKRNLKTEGSLPSLKSTLYQYIKGNAQISDFNNTNISDKSNELNLTTMTDNKNERIPFCKPPQFSGAIHENVNTFIQKFNKASDINGWSKEQKNAFFPMYLVNTAATFIDNFENRKANASWEETEKAFRLEFEPTAQQHMLRTMLEKRKQLPDESVASYINEAENLCTRIDKNMSQAELVHTIMRGLKPDIARYVGILDNNSLDDLKSNIRKYESIEFMINGNQQQSPDEIRAQITSEHLNTINESKTDKQISQLSSQISDLKEIIRNMNTNNNNEYRENIQYQKKSNNYQNYNNNTQQYNNQKHRDQLPNNYNNNHRQQPNNYNNRFNNYRNNSINRETDRNNYNQPDKYRNYSNQHNNNNSRTQYYSRQNDTQKYNNTRTPDQPQCEHCHKNNHSSEECKWKLICTICNKRYHTAETCFSKTQNQNQKN